MPRRQRSAVVNLDCQRIRASLLSGKVDILHDLPMLGGLMLGGAGLAGLTVAGAGTSYPLLVPPLIASGFGMAFTMPAALRGPAAAFSASRMISC